MEKSIGIDVAKKKLDVSFFNGKEHQQLNCDYTEMGMGDIVQRIEQDRRSNFTITMEATGTYHLRVATFLHEKGYNVSVVNPLIIKRYSEMKMLRAKTDPVDARLIAEYGYEQKAAIFKPRMPECQELLDLLKTIDGFYQIKTQNRNRLEALTQSVGYSERAVASIQRINSIVDEEVKNIERRIKQLIQEHYSEEYNRLITIPGIGKRTAAAIIGYFQKFEQFETAKQVASFIGINPSRRESGTSIRGRGAISRKGNRYLRKLFYMAALSASRHNHSCAQLYSRLLADGKEKKVALIAVANKLIRQVFAIAKYQREYNPLYQAA
jgi:transposase